MLSGALHCQHIQRGKQAPVNKEIRQSVATHALAIFPANHLISCFTLQVTSYLTVKYFKLINFVFKMRSKSQILMFKKNHFALY